MADTTTAPQGDEKKSLLKEFLELYPAVINAGWKIWTWLILYPGIVLLFLFTTGLSTNVLGIKEVSLYIEIILLIVAIPLFLVPRTILSFLIAGIASGIIRSPETITGEIKRFFEIYLEIVKNILLYISLVFLFLGTSSFEGKAWTIPAIVLLSAFLILASNVWKIGGKLAKKLIYGYACLLLAAYILVLVPSTAWYQIIGFDPVEEYGNSENEALALKIQRAERENEEGGKKEILRGVLEKVRDGKKISELPIKEQERLNEYLEKIQEKSAPSKVKKAWDVFWKHFSSQKNEQVAQRLPEYTFSYRGYPEGVPTRMLEIGNGEKGQESIRFQFKSMSGWKWVKLFFNPRTGYFEGFWGDDLDENKNTRGPIELKRDPAKANRWVGQMKGKGKEYWWVKLSYE